MSTGKEAITDLQGLVKYLNKKSQHLVGRSGSLHFCFTPFRRPEVNFDAAVTTLPTVAAQVSR
jgi:hypothetical protein